jgi:hypothetical protein
VPFTRGYAGRQWVEHAVPASIDTSTRTHQEAGTGTQARPTRQPRSRSASSAATLPSPTHIYAGSPGNQTSGADGQPSGSTPTTSLAWPTGSSDGLVSVDAGAAGQAEPDVATAVVTTLDTYFANINSRDLPSAYGMYSAQQQANVPYAQWSTGVSESQISGVAITGFGGSTQSLGAGQVTASLTFISQQPASRGPAGQSCTRWALLYTLVPDQALSGYLIDKAKAEDGAGFNAC